MEPPLRESLQGQLWIPQQLQRLPCGQNTCTMNSHHPQVAWFAEADGHLAFVVMVAGHDAEPFSRMLTTAGQGQFVDDVREWRMSARTDPGGSP